MDIIFYFKELFESLSDYRKIVLLMFLINDNKNLLTEVGFSKNNIYLLSLEFKIILLEDNTWSTRYNVPKNDRYSDSSTQWTKLSLNFTVENYGIKLIYDQIDTPHADMCFSNISITHSV